MPLAAKLKEITGPFQKQSAFTDGSFISVLYSFQKIQHGTQKLSSFLAFYSTRLELIGLLQQEPCATKFWMADRDLQMKLTYRLKEVLE